LKAGDAATIGGLPPSAFVLAAPPNGSSAAESAGTVSATSGVNPNVGGTGTTDFIPLWTDSTGDLGNSVMFQSGGGSTAKVGINITTPATTLDVKGAGTIRGQLSVLGTLLLPATGPATATAGKNSEPLNLAASAFNSSSSTAVNQVFQWQAEPASNDTSTPSGTLNLLFGEGTTKPSETGLHIASNGQITFATGQTFPGTGTGDGTITSVTAGTDLTGGGTSGPVTLNLDTTKVPQLGATNTFTANQTVNGTLTAKAATGNAIVGDASATIGDGVVGTTAGAFGSGVVGQSTTAGGTGVTGTTTNGVAVYGFDKATSGSGFGVLGTTNAPAGYGVEGSSPNLGVYGTSSGTSSTGSGHGNAGVWGDTGGAAGDGFYGVLGTADQNSAGGFYNNGAYATIYASNFGSGNGLQASGGTGVVGVSTGSGPGGSFTGYTQTGSTLNNGTDGIDATGGQSSGVCGTASCSNGGAGVMGMGGSGENGGFDGVGGSFIGADGSPLWSDVGGSGDGVDGIAGTGWAGDFVGNVNTTGIYNSSGGEELKIDHPLDPANKYLVHASVESSEMMNIYTGNVTTDAQGQATVQLPEWFEVLNTDFRYQLTVIGQFAQAIVAREIENNQLEIRTNAPNVKVSWQVTGVRQDAYAKANPLVVEQEKDARLRGFYIHPEFYGAPPEKQIEWARHPQMMKRIQEMRAKQLAPKTAAQPVPAQPAPAQPQMQLLNLNKRVGR